MRLLGGQDFSRPVDFEALESSIKSSMMDLGAALLGSFVNADQRDCQGPELACACGGRAHYCGRRHKTFTSTLGRLTLSRAYYHCKACTSGIYPRDEALGMTERSVSPGVLKMIGQSAARMSFAESARLLWELAKVRVSVKQVERSAENLGDRIAADERHVIEAEPNQAKTLYLGMDGTGVPMRAAEVAGVAGKQPDGSARTREVKLVAVWSAESLSRKGRPQRDPGSVSYNAAIESAATRPDARQMSQFARRVEREAHRRQFYLAARQVVLGDGAPWIWNLCYELFPKAIQIVDIFHAKQKVWDVGKTIYGTDTDLTQPWVQMRLDELDDGDIDALLAAFSGFAKHHHSVVQAMGYFNNNAKRMRYREFRAQDLCVSSGVLEAGCKTAIAERLKQAGMHWTVDGANAIAALRCSVLSNRFDDFWYRKAAGQR